MRILHLVANLEKGGAEKQLFLLARETSHFIEHRVLAIKAEGPWATELRKCGATVSCWFQTQLSTPSLVPRLAREIRHRRPDIVHCWLPSINLLGGIAAALACPSRPRVVASIRNVDDWKPSWRVWLDRAASFTWDAVVCNSQAGLECARRQGIPTSKLCWIPNGLASRAPGDRLGERARLGISAHQPLLAAASRLVPQKRVDRILDVAAGLRVAFPELQVLIAGDGPERAHLESRAARELPQTVRFLGDLPDPRPLLTAADAFLVTSEREGTSNSLLEALQAGCPVFATDAGDNRLLIGQAGFAGPAPMLAAALSAALRTPARLDEMRRNASLRAADFSVSRMASQTAALYRRILAPANVPAHKESSHA